LYNSINIIQFLIENKMKNQRLLGKVILITGSLGLIGKQIAKAYSDNGASVVVTDIQEQKKIDAFIKELNIDKCLGIQLDITNIYSIKRALKKIINYFGKIDVLVNNAAVDNSTFDKRMKDKKIPRFENYNIENLNDLYNVNTKGTVLITQAVIKNMLKQGNGNIINVTSTYAFVAPNQDLYKLENDNIQSYKPIDYIISKSFIPIFTKYLTSLYADHGIRINTIAPHGVENNHSETLKEILLNLLQVGECVMLKN